MATPGNTLRLLAVCLLILSLGLFAGGAVAQRGQTLAPHETDKTDGPAAIVWPTPDLRDRMQNFESAEERQLRLRVIVKELEQPWSIAFLPDGANLVTERPGRLRIIRDGRLDPDPVEGVPEVQTGGARGLQGLMDIALHPQFATNRWLYLTDHKPSPDGGGATTLARARWDGSRLTDVIDIFESGATETEASRLVFGGDERNVFVAGLREGGVRRTGHIERIVFNERWQEVRREPMLTDLHQRVRDVRQGRDGLLYVLTAENDGALLRIEPRAK